MDSGESVHVELPPDELRLLRWGLANWGGPGYCTDAMAKAMGFEDAHTMLDEVEGLRRDLVATSSLTPRDWSRALIALEVVFASDVIGAAGDWAIVTGWTDEQTLVVLRTLQNRLRGVRSRIIDP